MIKATRARSPALRATDIEQGLVSGLGLWASICRRAALHPDCPLIFLSDRWPGRTTVGAALRRAEGVAAKMAQLGFARGDVLAVQLPHGEANTLILLAAIRLGLVVVSLVPSLGVRELGFILGETGAKGLVVPDRFRGTDYVARFESLGDLPECRYLLVLGEAPCEAIALQSLLAPGPSLTQADETTGNDVFAVIYTSGTTAAPKGVIHSHSSFEAELLALGGLYREPWTGGFLNAMPAGHIAGMTAALRAFFHGMPCVYMDQWDAAKATAAIREHGLTWTMGTGFHLAQLLAEAGEGDLGTLRAMLLGGATINPELVAAADRKGVKGFRAYGSSEYPSLTCGAPWDSLDRRSQTDGQPPAGSEIMLVDDLGCEVATGERGEILCRGPEMFEGFVDPALNVAAFTEDGWYRTGDIGQMDRHGSLTIVDRKKDIIIRGGENISSREVEEILLRHDGVLEAAAVGFPDPLYGERVAVFVQVGATASVTLDSVRQHFVAAGIARQKTPEKLLLIADFPRTASGKIIKAELRRRLAELQAAAQ